jgi:hypothetical protein
MPPPRLLTLLAAIGLVGMVIGISGCGSTNPYSVSEGDIAERYLPGERHVDYPPDSLHGLSIRETDERIAFDLDDTYHDLMVRWSSSFRAASARRTPNQPLTYATLWSLELSLVSLQLEMGIKSLPKEKARELIATRRKEYQDEIQIDVYWFGSPSGSAIAGPGTQVRLRDAQGNNYTPIKRDYGPAREAFLSGGRTVIYRRNTFLFNRRADGRDVLATTDEVSLFISPLGTSTLRFSWSWDSPGEGGSSPEAPPSDTRSR